MGEEAEVGDMLIDDDDDESACKYVNACDVYVFIEEKWRSGCCFLEGEFSEGGRYASSSKKIISVESATTVILIIII